MQFMYEGVSCLRHLAAGAEHKGKIMNYVNQEGGVLTFLDEITEAEHRWLLDNEPTSDFKSVGLN